MKTSETESSDSPGSPIRSSSAKLAKPVLIRVDDREADSGTVAALREMEGVELEVARLPMGDYEVDGAFLFERKSLLDLAASIQDGRLFRQARAMAASKGARRVALILEGTSASLSDCAMRRESIQGALITVTLFFAIPLLRSLDGVESARLMVYTARQAKWFASGALPRHGKRPQGKRKAQLALLQGLPGVGPERAQRLLDRFGSVEAVVTAAAEELTAVDGIGKRTAHNIRWVVGEPGAPTYRTETESGTAPRRI